MNRNASSPVIDRLVAWSLAHPMNVAARSAIVTALVIAVGTSRAFLVASIVPWLLFVPVVLGVGLMFGRSSGVYATILSTVVAAASIGSVAVPFWLTSAQWIGSAVFVIVATCVSVMLAGMQAAYARATALTQEKDAATVLMTEREAFLAGVLASSTDCIKVLDLDARRNFMSEGGRRIRDVSAFATIAGMPWPDF